GRRSRLDWRRGSRKNDGSCRSFRPRRRTFLSEGGEALAPLGATQRFRKTLRRGLDVGLGGQCAAGREETLGLRVCARRAAFDRPEQRLELLIPLRLSLAKEVGEADRLRLTPVETGAGQRKTPRDARAHT